MDAKPDAPSIAKREHLVLPRPQKISFLLTQVAQPDRSHETLITIVILQYIQKGHKPFGRFFNIKQLGPQEPQTKVRIVDKGTLEDASCMLEGWFNRNAFNFHCKAVQGGLENVV